jgi:hypothetical protein
MAETENNPLKDKNIVPEDDLIFSIIGENKILWQSIMQHMHIHYNNITEEWRYYNDGKQWLFKLLQKKKTIFWISIVKDTFRITFYFGDKAEPLIFTSDLPESIKHDFRTGKRYGKIRPVSLKICDQTDVDPVLKLAAIKCKMK